MGLVKVVSVIVGVYISENSSNPQVVLLNDDYTFSVYNFENNLANDSGWDANEAELVELKSWDVETGSWYLDGDEFFEGESHPRAPDWLNKGNQLCIKAEEKTTCRDYELSDNLLYIQGKNKLHIYKKINE